MLKPFGLALVSVLVLLSLMSEVPMGAAQTQNEVPVMPSGHASAMGKYWFQVGAQMEKVDATGASVEIQVKTPQTLADPEAALAYWVGINLPGDAFIQAGYEIWQEPSARWFWEYFPPGTASKGAKTEFLGKTGARIGPNGTWVRFSLASNGNVWFAYVNSQEVGSIDLGISNSRGNPPYAMAEVSRTARSDNVLGPVGFRNLQYRDAANHWHKATSAVSICCYGAGSDELGGSIPFYGVQRVIGVNNTWLAGSNLEASIQERGVYLWPWYLVAWSSPYTDTSSWWYVYGATVNVDISGMPGSVPISTGTRFHLKGWTVNGQYMIRSGETFNVQGEMDLEASYVKQDLVQVTSPIGIPTGSGWYDDGADATISINPSSIPETGILGLLGVKSTLSGWTGDYAGSITNGDSIVQVHSPMHIMARWSTDYGILPYVFVALAIAVSVWFLARRRRNASDAHS